MKPILPEISVEDRSPLIDAFLEFTAWQGQRIDALEQEILKLKGETTKPVIKPSRMDDDSTKGGAGGQKKKGPRRKKTIDLTVHKTCDIHPDKIPEGSVFKGFREVVVQDIVFQPFNTRYRLAQYQAPDGHYVSGQVPGELHGCRFGKTLISFILYQYHHQHVTQPLLLKQLRDIGTDISSGHLSQLITDGLSMFHEEKDAIFKAGLSVSQYIHTDDTGARHQGKNGYCTHIGNELFAWFRSSESKSRINFLNCLSQPGSHLYALNVGAMEYMARQKLPLSLLNRFENRELRIDDTAAWEQWLDKEAIENLRHRKILTEGALMGGLLTQGLSSNLSIISDDAGQFNVFDHALCWIHAERIFNRLLPVSEIHAAEVERIREKLWSLYRDLKSYKLAPTEIQAKDIKARFTVMCEQQTSYATLNLALQRMGGNQHELLRVLDKPYLPLHNNLSERDIRDYVKKRKISGSTRSDKGRKARDTFASLKKTCLKHGLSFWDFLQDRVSGKNEIPRLSDLIRSAVTCG